MTLFWRCTAAGHPDLFGYAAPRRLQCLCLLPVPLRNFLEKDGLAHQAQHWELLLSCSHSTGLSRVTPKEPIRMECFLTPFSIPEGWVPWSTFQFCFRIGAGMSIAFFTACVLSQSCKYMPEGGGAPGQVNIGPGFLSLCPRLCMSVGGLSQKISHPFRSEHRPWSP